MRHKKITLFAKNMRWSIILLVIVAIIVSTMLLLAGLKITFSIKDELNPEISPQRISVNTTNNQQVLLNFTLKNTNFRQCKTSCLIEFKDVSADEVMDSQTVLLEHEEVHKSEYLIQTPRRGEGQKIYSYRTVCNNLRSTICLTDEEPRYRTGLVTINYFLSEEDSRIKKEVRTRLGLALGELANTTAYAEETTAMLYGMPSPIRTAELIGYHNQTIEQLNALNRTLAGLTQAWEDQEYGALNTVDWTLISEQLQEVQDRLSEQRTKGLSLVEERNQMIGLLQEAQNQSAKLLELAIRIDSAEGMAKKILDEANRLQNEPAELKQEISRDVQIFLALGKELEEKDRLAEFMSLFANAILLIKTGNASASSYSCEAYNSVYSMLQDTNNHTSNATDQLENLALIRLNSTLQDQAMIALIPKFVNNVTINETEARAADVNLALFEPYLEKCSNASNEGIKDLAAQNFTTTPPVNISIQPQQIVLEENNPQCCALGSCTECCDASCEPKYPVIFLHGHSFNKRNSPEFSMNSFALIQDQMTGYINAGELDLTSADDLGRSSTPISLRTSYYYITDYSIAGMDFSIQKDERIENYAVRLREIVENVKRITKAKKVNLIAHSMGGLVVREYLALFGTSEVDKAILINTPNHGVSKEIEALCGIIGSKKECEDLSQDSIFLKRLNAREIPENLYVIRSIGCDMDGEGDGIVLNSSAYLEGAKNYLIRGECKDLLNSNLHMRVLNPDLHPELPELVAGILEE